jgi:hypothetical protein
MASMQRLFGYGLVLLVLAASGAGCAKTEIMSDDNQQLAHETHVLGWKYAQMTQRNAARRNQADSFSREIDARDIEFYSSRIPGNRTDTFQE